MQSGYKEIQERSNIRLGTVIHWEQLLLDKIEKSYRRCCSRKWQKQWQTNNLKLLDQDWNHP